MNDRLEPMGTLNERATKALIREIGVVGTIRFFERAKATTPVSGRFISRGRPPLTSSKRSKDQRPGGKND